MQTISHFTFGRRAVYQIMADSRVRNLLSELHVLGGARCAEFLGFVMKAMSTNGDGSSPVFLGIFPTGGTQSTLHSEYIRTCLDAAYEMCWEALHSGTWRDVAEQWRNAFALSSVMQSAIQLQQGSYMDAMKTLDMAVLMGAELFRDDIQSVITWLHSQYASDSFHSTSASIKNQSTPPVLPSHLSLKDVPISRKHLPSIEEFLCLAVIPSTPLIITGAMSTWPAVTRWRDFGYLSRVAGMRTVPVEVGKNYLESDWTQELMTLSSFIDGHLSQSASTSGAQVAYLAQHPLFDQIPDLKKDICTPDYCALGSLEGINAWIGPQGTVTPLHHDPHHNLFAQVVGTKYIRLYSPKCSAQLYPYQERMLCNSSQVDVDNVDESRFPEFTNAEYVDCVLREGELLYMPPKWWHYVRSLSISISVNFWFSME